MTDARQYRLDLIPHSYNGELIQQRHKDGYINATAMCKAAGKNWADYNRTGPTKAYVKELSDDMGKPITELIQSLSGGNPALQGTWVHPHVAIHLAQWCSAKFSIRVSRWVHEWMTNGSIGPGKLPYHLRRYIANVRNVPIGHFSVLNEITLGLIAPLEADGYTLPQKLWPDISEGKMFAKYIRDTHGIDTDSLPTYTQTFEDGRPPVQAKAYPDAWLVAFRKHLHEVWIPERAAAYFLERDPKALPHLPKLLPKKAA